MNAILEKIMELGAAEDRACSEAERTLVINEAKELYNKHLANGVGARTEPALPIQDVSISLPHLEATLAEKTLLLVSKESQNNKEARRLEYDIELLTNSINAIKGNEC